MKQQIDADMGGGSSLEEGGLVRWRKRKEDDTLMGFFFSGGFRTSRCRHIDEVSAFFSPKIDTFRHRRESSTSQPRPSCPPSRKTSSSGGNTTRCEDRRRHVHTGDCRSLQQPPVNIPWTPPVPKLGSGGHLGVHENCEPSGNQGALSST